MRRPFPAARRTLAILLAGAALAGCSEPLPRPVERTAHLDTIQFAPELDVRPDELTRVASKLYMRDLRLGDGPEILKADPLLAHIEGWLPSGEKIVDSRAAGEPMTFNYGIGDLVRGLDLALEGMRIGGKRRVIVPPAMAYGVEGTERIPPYSTIVFDIEIVGQAQ